MAHQCQRLPLGLKAGDHLLGVHAQFDNLHRNGSANAVALLSSVYVAHAPFADLLKDMVAADVVGQFSEDVREALKGVGRFVGDVRVRRHGPGRICSAQASRYPSAQKIANSG